MNRNCPICFEHVTRFVECRVCRTPVCCACAFTMPKHRLLACPVCREPDYIPEGSWEPKQKRPVNVVQFRYYDSSVTNVRVGVGIVHANRMACEKKTVFKKITLGVGVVFDVLFG